MKIQFLLIATEVVCASSLSPLQCSINRFLCNPWELPFSAHSINGILNDSRGGIALGSFKNPIWVIEPKSKIMSIIIENLSRNVRC